MGTVLHWLHQKRWSRPRVILAHGTEEEDSVLQRFDYLQHLAPCYRDAWKTSQPLGQHTFAIPNFVDTDLFHVGDRREARARWNLPQNALVVLSVAALNQHHKRCDYVMREFATFKSRYQGEAVLVFAGARELETPQLLELGQSLLPNGLYVFESVERGRLPSLYRAADIFALGSLHEMLGTAILEALACGLPITCNRTPTLEWVAGPAGTPEDISVSGGLVHQWERLLDAQVRSRRSNAARRHAEGTFSESVVVRQIVDMYDVVMRS